MPFRTWMYVVALGLALSATSAWPQSALENEPESESGQENGGADSNEATQENEASTSGIVPALQGVEAAIRDLIAEEDKIEADRQRENESRDLKAQEGMAKWAEWMFWATAATVVLTLVALFAIIRTLHHTKRVTDYTKDMLKEARKTTVAAELQAKTAMVMMHHADRPHLFVQDVQSVTPFFKEWAIGQEQSKEFFDVTYRVQNFGRSPAIILEKRQAIYFCKKLPREPIFLPSDTFVLQTPLGPHPDSIQSQVFLRKSVTDSEAAELWAGQTHIEGVTRPKIYAFFYHKYRSPLGAIDEIGSIFRYIPQSDIFVEEDIPNYSFRTLGDAEAEKKP